MPLSIILAEQQLVAVEHQMEAAESIDEMRMFFLAAGAAAATLAAAVVAAIVA